MPVYQKAAETAEYSLPSDPECKVVMFTRVPYGVKKAANAAMLDMTFGRGAEGNGKAATSEDVEMVTKAEVELYLDTLLLGSIVSWNLADELGKALPITIETINSLKEEDGDFLEERAKAAIARRPVEQQQNLSNGSSAS